MWNASTNPMENAGNVTSLTTTNRIRMISDDVILYVTHISTIAVFVFAVIGVIGNVINMVVFSKLGFQESVNISLFCLSVSDFLVSVVSIFIGIGINPALAENRFPFELTHITLVFAVTPRAVFFKITKTITAFVTFERCLCVVMPLKIKLFLTVTRVELLMTTIFVSITLSNIPLFYIQPLRWNVFPHLNRTIFSMYTRSDAGKIRRLFFPIHAGIFSMFLYPFIITCTVVLIINLQRKLAWREKTSTTGTKKTCGISQKDRKVAKAVAMVSGAFLVFGLPGLCMEFCTSFVDGFTPLGQFGDIYVFLLPIAGLFQCLNSAINVFIYYSNSSNFREMFTRVFISVHVK